ncbi:MAG: UbiA family prenyltransferase [Granulosicoccus sp.]|nr:UbiA family prenyltransferase [Granulosicoccus sp.]
MPHIKNSINTDYKEHIDNSGWTLSTALTLGRVSNLPTIWTNVIAACLLSGGQLSITTLSTLLLAMSAAYIGGMFLNDAYDHQYDSIYRPERPIPSGKIPASHVFNAGYGLLGLSVLLTYLVAIDWKGPGSCVMLCAFIIIYNRWHKGNVLSPLLMGICRCLVYTSCALAVSSTISLTILITAGASLAYLIGLTYTAKTGDRQCAKELWPMIAMIGPLMIFLFAENVDWLSVAAGVLFLMWLLQNLISSWRKQSKVSVGKLIAGICLLDGLLICLFAHHHMGTVNSVLTNELLVSVWLLCTLFCASTVWLQRKISGT